MILKLLDKDTGESQSYPIRSNEDFTPIIMLYPEVRSIVFSGYETSDLTQDYSPRLRKITDDVAEYLKQFNLEVEIESENIWEMHDPMNPFEKSSEGKRYSANHVARHWLTQAYGPEESDWAGAVEDYEDELKNHSNQWELSRVPVDSLATHHPEDVDSSAMINRYTNQRNKGSEFPPIIIDKKGTTIDGMHRLNAAKRMGQTHINAYVPAKDIIGKVECPVTAKAETFIAAASLILALTTTFLPANLAKADVTRPVINVFKYRPYGHKPEDKFLQAIMQLESAGGLNQNHPEPSCIGRWGLMSATIKDMVRLFDTHNEDTKSFINLETSELKQIFKKHPELELHVARILARYVIARQRGDLARAAYAWKYGQNTPNNSITEDMLMNEPYVQKFKELVGTISKSEPNNFDEKLREWISKRKQKEEEPELWSPSIPDYSVPREPDPAYLRDTSKLRANIARANK